jgi:hypothetical protein
VEVREATPFTLFGEVRTGEQVGVAEEACCEVQGPATLTRRVGLPLV